MTLLAVYFFVNYHTASLKMLELNGTRKSLEAEIQSLEEDVARLNDMYAYVQTEEAVERQAREKLKMVKNNEIIYMIRESDASTKEEKNEKSNP